MFSSKILPTSVRGTNSVALRTICHKSRLPPKRNNYHWPYERRSWSLLNFYLDRDTAGKFDENTKIIQVEGNISAGKEEFAKRLADELGMAYFPQPTLEDYYKNRHGFDYTALNGLLPERLRYCNWAMYHENPQRHSVLHMQHFLFRMRCFQYLKAASHLFNTGQGVVLTRTCFTERALVEAMHEIGWLPRGYLRGDGVRFYEWKCRYLSIRNMTLARLHKPHLTIYLDTPVDTCLERIRKDPNPMIANSKALPREFLEEVERAFKDIVLPKQDFNGHVMIVDHPEHKSLDEINDIIDDIEKLNFEYDVHDLRFTDWNPESKFHWYFDNRVGLTTRRYARKLNENLEAPWFDIAGLGDSISHGDLALREGLFEGHVGPVGHLQSYETDREVHGFLPAFFGKLNNFGERRDKLMKLDCQ